MRANHRKFASEAHCLNLAIFPLGEGYMEPELPIIKAAVVDDDTPMRPKKCMSGWIAIGLLLLTWLCIILVCAFFWKKINDFHFSTSANLTKNKEQFSQYQNNLVQLQALIQKNISPDKNLIQVNEAKYLIQLANYNLLYLSDQNSALSALNLAEKKLANLSQVSVSTESLHNLLTQNIATLNALPLLDLNKTLGELNALKTQLAALPLLASAPTAKEIVNSQAQSNPEKNWIKAMQASLNSFKELIVIRRLDKPIEPLLPQIQQQYLKQDLQLLFEQAQWALLHHHQEIYNASLQQAKKNIQQYYAEQSPDAQTIMQHIDQLNTINIQPVLPDLSPTLQAVDDLIVTIASKPTDQKETPS